MFKGSKMSTLSFLLLLGILTFLCCPTPEIIKHGFVSMYLTLLSRLCDRHFGNILKIMISFNEILKSHLIYIANIPWLRSQRHSALFNPDSEICFSSDLLRDFNPGNLLPVCKKSLPKFF